MIALFKFYCCPSCDQPINKAECLERDLTTWTTKCRRIFLKNLSQQLDSFGFVFTANQKLFNNITGFDIEPTCAEDEKFKDTERTTRTWKHSPCSVLILSNSIQKPIFLCDFEPSDLLSSFIEALKSLAAQNQIQIKREVPLN